MKAIVATAIVTALLATSAVAAPRAPRGQQFDQVRGQAYDADAYRSGVVMSGDRVLGQDPDPAVRTQLRQQGDISAN